ncbi:unnamed protein product, partial [Polarella glacialis]
AMHLLIRVGVQAELEVPREEEDEDDRPLRMRRPPPRTTAENHVFVGRQQSLAVLFKIVRRLLDSRGYREVFVHGMGASITKAVHLGQDLLLHYGEELMLEPSIGTVEVVDDIIGSYDAPAEERRVSSLTLRLHRSPLATAAASQMSAGDEPMSIAALMAAADARPELLQASESGRGRGRVIGESPGGKGRGKGKGKAKGGRR